MDEDEGSVLPINFSAVGSILLEFTNRLSTHLVSDSYSDLPGLMGIADASLVTQTLVGLGFED